MCEDSVVYELLTEESVGKAVESVERKRGLLYVLLPKGFLKIYSLFAFVRLVSEIRRQWSLHLCAVYTVRE